jgi:dTDP-4-dehydrorhamnose reductase
VSLVVLVTGARGMLGMDVVNFFSQKATVIALGHEELDITRREACSDAVDGIGADVVVNCAAFTRVDLCETEREKAYLINANGPEYLSLACSKKGAVLVQISTDYVFDGSSTRPYREDDAVAPLNVYGASKLAGERAIIGSGAEHVIARTSWLYGRAGQNFVKTILRLAGERDVLKVVNDQLGSPTFTADLARGLWNIVERRGRGVFHLSNQESCSWYDLAREAMGLAGEDPARIIPISTHEFPTPARRPRYSVLDNSMYESLTGDPMRNWKDALKEYFRVDTG